MKRFCAENLEQGCILCFGDLKVEKSKKKMAKNDESFEALIFIDTNILVDFYRIRKSDVSLKYLNEIENHLDLIITSSQVEMEFTKNRQSVILESIAEVKKIGTPPVNEGETLMCIGSEE